MSPLVLALEHAGYDGTADRIFAAVVIFALVLWLVVNLTRDELAERRRRPRRPRRWRPLP